MLKLKRTVLYQMLLLCTLLLTPLAARAGTISVIKVSDTSFNLVANGLGAPGGFDLTVTYDTAHLSTPTVTGGSLLKGALIVANTNSPSTIHIAIIAHPAMAGTGTIATITFKSGDAAGAIGVSGSAIDSSGKPLLPSFYGWSAGTDQTAASSTGNPSSGGGGNSGGSGTGTTAGTTSGTTIPFVAGGTLTMPTDETAPRKETPQQQQAPQESRENPAPAPAPVTAPAPVSAEPTAPAEAQPPAKKAQAETPKSMPSVLEKFRLFTGEKTPANLIALFDRDPAASFSQSPALLIADGKSSVKVVVAKIPGEKAPNFTFNRARYLSLSQAADGGWQIEVVPDKGALRASITMLADSTQLEIPLTVAPQANVDLDKSGTVTEADFQTFLKSRGTDAAPLFDLNGDGKRDYQDDYIFTANYLVQHPAQKKPQ